MGVGGVLCFIDRFRCSLGLARLVILGRELIGNIERTICRRTPFGIVLLGSRLTFLINLTLGFNRRVRRISIRVLIAGRRRRMMGSSGFRRLVNV